MYSSDDEEMTAEDRNFICDDGDSDASEDYEGGELMDDDFLEDDDFIMGDEIITEVPPVLGVLVSKDGKKEYRLQDHLFKNILSYVGVYPYLWFLREVCTDWRVFIDDIQLSDVDLVFRRFETSWDYKPMNFVDLSTDMASLRKNAEKFLGEKLENRIHLRIEQKGDWDKVCLRLKNARKKFNSIELYLPVERLTTLEELEEICFMGISLGCSSIKLKNIRFYSLDDEERCTQVLMAGSMRGLTVQLEVVSCDPDNRIINEFVKYIPEETWLENIQKENLDFDWEDLLRSALRVEHDSSKLVDHIFRYYPPTDEFFMTVLHQLPLHEIQPYFEKYAKNLNLNDVADVLVVVSQGDLDIIKDVVEKFNLPVTLNTILKCGDINRILDLEPLVKYLFSKTRYHSETSNVAMIKKLIEKSSHIVNDNEDVSNEESSQSNSNNEKALCCVIKSLIHNFSDREVQDIMLLLLEGDVKAIRYPIMKELMKHNGCISEKIYQRMIDLEEYLLAIRVAKLDQQVNLDILAEIIRYNDRNLFDLWYESGDSWPNKLTEWMNALGQEKLIAYVDGYGNIIETICKGAVFGLLQKVISMYPSVNWFEILLEKGPLGNTTALHWACMSNSYEPENKRIARLRIVELIVEEYLDQQDLETIERVLTMKDSDGKVAKGLTLLKRIRDYLEKYMKNKIPQPEAPRLDIIFWEGKENQTQIPHSIFDHIVEYLQPFPDYLLLQAVSATWYTEFLRYQERAETLDLIYRGPGTYRHFYVDQYADLELVVDIEMEAWKILRTTFPQVKCLKVDYAYLLHLFLRTFLNQSIKSPIELEKLQVYWPIFGNITPIDDGNLAKILNRCNVSNVEFYNFRPDGFADIFQTVSTKTITIIHPYQIASKIELYKKIGYPLTPLALKCIYEQELDLFASLVQKNQIKLSGKFWKDLILENRASIVQVLNLVGKKSFQLQRDYKAILLGIKNSTTNIYGALEKLENLFPNFWQFMSEKSLEVWESFFQAHWSSGIDVKGRLTFIYSKLCNQEEKDPVKIVQHLSSQFNLDDYKNEWFQAILKSPDEDWDKADENGKTLLHMFILKGQNKMLTSLLEHSFVIGWKRYNIDVNRHFGGKHPILIACEVGNIDIVYTLMKFKSIVDKPEEVIPTCLESQHDEMAFDLVEHFIESTTEDQIAKVIRRSTNDIKPNNVKLEQYLLRLSKDSIIKAGDGEISVFHAICQSTYPEILEYISYLGRSTIKDLIQHVDNGGNNCFHYAVAPLSFSRSGRAMVRSLLSFLTSDEVVNLLNQKNKKGDTPAELCEDDSILEEISPFIDDILGKKRKRNDDTFQPRKNRKT